MTNVENELNKKPALSLLSLHATDSSKLDMGEVQYRETVSGPTCVDLAVDTKEKEIENSESTNDIEEFDGGYGWLVVLGAFCVQVTSFGVVSTWGVMQDYYHQNMFSDNPKAVVDLSFVGTLTLVFINGASPLVQVCVARYGLRQVIIVGTLFVTIALEMAGFSYEIWHLYLSQGILFGLGASCLYVTVMSVTPQWFTKNRGVALGIVASGSGIGGLVMPFIVTPINRTLGPGWTYRILGFICLACDAVACIFVKERKSNVPKKTKLSQIIRFDVLKNVNFLIFCIGSDVALFGYFIPFFFVPANATYLGLSDSQGSSMIAVVSAMNFIGRFVAGFMADRIGRLNSNILFTLLAAISCLLIWTFSFSYGSLMAFSVVFGFACGSYFALMSPISASILGMEKFPSGLSLLLLFNMIPVFGANIASAIESGAHSRPFLSYKLFSGVAFLVGTIILIVLKLRLNKNPFAKV